MKKLVGGDYLLDLTPIELEESEDVETYTNITNKEIIEQLTNLKKFVPNPSMVKPVWVKLKNGETDEIVVVRGEFKVVDAGEFEIVVAIDGYKLKIHIEFTQALNEDNDPIDDWYIAENDAKYLFTSDAQNIGAISELPVFENIVDAQGHKRFIEGQGEVAEISGLTATYNKWSLSGTHLMIVLCGTCDVGTYSGRLLTIKDLPQWVLDKIIPNISSEYIALNGKQFFHEFTATNVNIQLTKNGSELRIAFAGPNTFTDSKTFRIEFDLLIDNVAPESQGE